MTPLKLLAIGAALATALAIPCAAQFGLGKKSPEKEAKDREKEREKEAKDALNYEKLKTYSMNLYENNLDFREGVDERFEEVLRLHSEQAYEKNISRNSQIVAVQEDRFRIHHALYDNLVIQDYVNRLGQRLVPPDSDKLFAFRLTPSPIPSAYAMSTGTIYLSTGLVAMLDNEAQLAYVLAHEMAHVYKDHWKLKAMLDLGEEKYNQRQETKRMWWSLAAAGAGAAFGAGIGRSGGDALIGAAAGGIVGIAVSSFLNPTMHLAWDKVQEDEADKIAFKAALDANYDVKEVPKLYLALQAAAGHDSRVGLGFMGSRKRVRERLENCKDLIDKAYKADIEVKQKEGRLIGDNPEYRNLMAELKRDNGILAFYYDMFEMARNNLGEAVSIRSNDPAAHYFYGKVLKLVGRTPEERKLADQSFASAVRYDKRAQNFGSHLHVALAMMDERTEANKAQIISEMQEYVNEYLRYAVNNARGSRLLPPNLDTIFEYMSLLGDAEWQPKLPDDTPMFVEANDIKHVPTTTPALTPAAAAPMPPKAAPVTQKKRLPLPR